MKLHLSNKVVLVTGAASGIGAAISKKLVNEGAFVVGIDINEKALENLIDTPNMLAITADMRDPKAAQSIIKQVIECHGKIDILINNAAVAQIRKGFMSVKDADWFETFNLNFMGYVRMSRAVLPHMLSKNKGLIIHIASEASVMPNPLLPDYSVFKSAVVSLSKSLSREFTKKNVRSNVISPGFIRTAIYDAPTGILHILAQKYGTSPEAALEKYLEEIDLPVGRLGSPEEVADLVLYVASENASFMSGTNILFEGGIVPTI